MNTQTKITYAWMIIGIIFAVLGIADILNGNIGGLLTIAIAGLVMFTSVHNMGGFEAFMWDVKKRIRLFGK
jgi:hypothetical protein